MTISSTTPGLLPTTMGPGWCMGLGCPASQGLAHIIAGLIGVVKVLPEFRPTRNWRSTPSRSWTPAAADCVVRVQGFRHLRNLVGAHHNEWAQTATWSEARRFADSVLELLSHVRCSTCSGWVRAVDRTKLECTCGGAVLSPLYFSKR